MGMITKEVLALLGKIKEKTEEMGYYWNGTEAAGDAADIREWVMKIEELIKEGG
jgi:hypothetical protein